MQDEHRLFVQIMMSKRIITKEEARRIVENKLQKAGQPLTQFVALVNEHLDEFSMKIAEGKAEDSGEAYYALVNLKENDRSAVLGNNYTPTEVEFFVKMIEEILNEADDDGLVSSLTLINLPSKMDKKMTASQADQFLQKMENALWLTKDESGRYAAGPRLLLDLKPFLQNDERVQKCAACEDIVVRGERHIVNGSEGKYHLYCAERLFRGSLPAAGMVTHLATMEP